MKKFVSALFFMALLVALTACKGDKPVTSEEEIITIKVAIGSLTPSEDMIQSPSNPNPVVIPYLVAQEFEKENPNIRVEFDRSISYKSKDEWNQYMVTTLSSGRAPDIVYGWNGDMLYKNWYVDLTEYLYTPNEYEEGNTSWKDMFPEYIFNDITSIDGKILGIPVLAFPGSPTVYYYNKEIFESFADPKYRKVPTTWEELLDLVDYIKTNYPSITPFGTNKDANIKQLANNWDMQFVLGPAYGMKIKEQLDYNGDGLFSKEEMALAVLNGDISTTKGPNMEAGRDLWMNIRKKYTQILPRGYASADFEKLWNEGKLAIMEDGMWRMADEIASTRRKDNFEFGMVPAVIIDHSTTESSEYIAQIEKTVGPYQPPLQEAYHIVKPSLQQDEAKKRNEEKIIDACVKFLKYLTAKENLDEIVAERKGSVLGATIDSKIPTELLEYFENEFPKIDSFRWFAPLTSEGQSNVTRLMEDWLQIPYPTEAQHNNFFNDLDQIYLEDVKRYAESVGMDISEWE